MTIENKIYTENFEKMNKLNIILYTILTVQIVLLDLNCLVLPKYWNMPNKADQKCISYILTANF